jgi:hypothetical protein
MLKVNPACRRYIDWEKFAEYAEKAGLHYHPTLGLMDAPAWDAIKEFVVDP